MKKNILLCGLFAVIFMTVGCKSEPKKEEPKEPVVQTVVSEEDSKVVTVDSVAKVEVVDSVGPIDTINETYAKSIVDTLIGGLNFKSYSFGITTKGMSDKILFVLPDGDNVEISHKIINQLLEDYSYGADSLEQQLEAQFERYAQSEQEDEEFFESELIMYPEYVLGKKYVAYSVHSSLFWPNEQNHPQWADVFYMYDLTTGDIVSQNDIFDDSQENIQAICTKLHEELVAFASNEEDIFAEADSSLLNGNLVFDDKCITYYYLPYEVGPYMLGEPGASLSKEWVRPYLKKEGPLYKYWFEK